MQKISPVLWFDGRAEEAVEFYTSTFKNSRVTQVARYGDSGPGPSGSIMTVTFEAGGQEFTALNGGPQFSFTPAVSFAIKCETQAEIDELWSKLPAGGGHVQQCGWLTDRFGVTWQVIPAKLPEMLRHPDPKRVQRVVEAVLKMNKLEIEPLRRVYEEP